MTVNDSEELRGDVSPTRRSRKGRMDAAARRRWQVLAVAVGFGLLYLWDVVEVVGNLVALLTYAEMMGGTLNSFAWLVLGLGVVFPPLIYVVAVLLARHRGPLLFGLALLTGLAAVACLGLVTEALLT